MKNLAELQKYLKDIVFEINVLYIYYGLEIETQEMHMHLNKLSQLRKRRGLNQRQLAEATHTAQSLISNVETGKLVPWPKLVSKLSEVLGVNPEDIFPSLKHSFSKLDQGKPCPETPKQEVYGAGDVE